GYDDAEHFLAGDAALCEVMNGATTTQHAQGKLRRTVLSLASGTAHDEVLSDLGAMEVPQVHPAQVGLAHGRAYVALTTQGDRIFPNAVMAFEAGGATDVWDFGPDAIAGEPIIAPKGASDTDGWLLVEVTDVATSRASLAVLDAGDLAA